MQYNVLTVITDLKGEELKKPSGESFLFKDAILMALLEDADKNKNASIEHKIRDYKLASRVANHDVLDLTLEERVYLKERIGAYFMPLIVGKFSEFIGE